jgi:hypothetical protein
MVVSVAVTKAAETIQANLQEAHRRLDLRPIADPAFFPEWQGNFADRSGIECAALDRLKMRYLDYAECGSITEGTVNFIMLSPLLELLGLMDSPFELRSEKYLRFEIEDGETQLEGLMDAVVLREKLWLVVIESKRYGFSVRQAIAQTLAYMTGFTSATRPILFGLVTTGEDFLFIKLDRSSRQYALSDKFTLSTVYDNQLIQVVQILMALVGE